MAATELNAVSIGRINSISDTSLNNTYAVVYNSSTGSPLGFEMDVIVDMDASLVAAHTDIAAAELAISNEVAARSNADTTLQDNIDAEASARSGADNTLQTNINNEAISRANADTSLQGNIDAEATARENADTSLAANLVQIESNLSNLSDNKQDKSVLTLPTTSKTIEGSISELHADTKSIRSLSYSIVEGYAINYSTGAEYLSETLNCTGPVNIEGISELVYARGKSTSLNPKFGMAFFNSLDTYISGQIGLGNYVESEMGYEFTKITVPENAISARFSFFKDENLGHFFVRNAKEALDFQIQEINNKSKAIEASIGYFECTTSSGTATKVVTNSNYALTKNGFFIVNFSQANSAADAILKVGNVEAPLYYNNVRLDADQFFYGLKKIHYDGTNFKAFDHSNLDDWNIELYNVLVSYNYSTNTLTFKGKNLDAAKRVYLYPSFNYNKTLIYIPVGKNEEITFSLEDGNVFGYSLSTKDFLVSSLVSSSVRVALLYRNGTELNGALTKLLKPFSENVFLNGNLTSSGANITFANTALLYKIEGGAVITLKNLSSLTFDLSSNSYLIFDNLLQDVRQVNSVKDICSNDILLLRYVSESATFYGLLQQDLKIKNLERDLPSNKWTYYGLKGNSTITNYAERCVIYIDKLEVYQKGNSTSVQYNVQASFELKNNYWLVLKSLDDVNLTAQIELVAAVAAFTNSAWIVLLRYRNNPKFGIIDGELYGDYMRWQEPNEFRVIPESPGVLNTCRKADQLRLLKWIPKSDVEGNSSTWSQGSTVTGVPYSSVKEKDKFIGYNVSFHTFMTAVNNPYSLLYTENISAGQIGWDGSTYHGVNCRAYFGAVCSSFCSYALGFKAKRNTYDFHLVDGMNAVTIQDAQYLKLGDLIWQDGHIDIVTDLYKNSIGEITKIYLSGTGSTVPYKVLYTPITFQSHLESINGVIYRWDNISLNNEYVASPYVAVENEASQEITYNNDICTFAGDMASFRDGERIKINYTKSSYTGMELYKNDVLIDTITLNADSEIHEVEITGSLSGYGLYKARLTDGSNNSDYTYFELLDCTVTYNEGGMVTFSSENADPLYVEYCNIAGFPAYIHELTAEEITAGTITEVPTLDESSTGDMYMKVHFKGQYGIVTNVPILTEYYN